MRIAVIGASGRTGRLVSIRALERGHELVAVVRDPSRLDLDDPGMTVARADARDAASLADAIIGCDAVVFAVGPGRDTAPDVMAVTLTATLDAMRRASVPRIVEISASGPFTDGDSWIMAHVAKPIVGRFLREPFADLAAAERILRDSDAEWTAVRPPQLHDREPRGPVKTRIGANLPWGMRVGRADLATAIVDAVEDPDSVHQVIAIAD